MRAEVLLGHGPRAGQGRGRESQPAAVALDPDKPGPALLDHYSVLPGDPAGLKPGMRRPQGGVAGKGELLAAGEDPDPVVCPGVRGRQQECGLGEVGPVGELLHRFRREPLGVDDDRQRIAAVGLGGEDVHLPKGRRRGAGAGFEVTAAGYHRRRSG